MKKKDVWIEIATLIIIFLISFVPRWITIEKLPYGFDGDELAWTITSLLQKYSISIT